MRARALVLVTGVLAIACTPVPSPVREAPTERPVRAVVISDLNGAYGTSEYAPAVHRAVRFIVADARPDFVLVAGDMIAGQAPRLADSVVRRMWTAFDSVVAAPLRDAGIPLVVTLGNHDGSGYPAHARDRRLAIEYWRGARRTAAADALTDDRDFPLRYTFAARDVFVAVWDATNQESATDDTLRQWLQEALTGAAARGARHRIVLAHLPLHAVAEGRNRAGEVLAHGDSLRRLVEGWGATLFVSGHHHAYYPGRRGALELLHAGALGGGPRPLIGQDAPSPKTVSVVDFHPDSLAIATWAIDEGSGALSPVPLAALPRVVCGVNGYVVRRDQPDRAGGCTEAAGGAAR